MSAAGLGLSDADRRHVVGSAEAVLHCAASISFDLPLEEAREINTAGTAARPRAGPRRRLAAADVVHVSTAYVSGRHRGRFREGDLDVSQSFRNSYERSKYEGELILHAERGDLPLAIARPSIVVGESTTGWTPAFNVIYWPLQAFARGLLDCVPASPHGRVDIVPVDYVADAPRSICSTTTRSGGTLHLVAGNRAVTNNELIDLACRHLGRPRPRLRGPARRAGPRAAERLPPLLRRPRRLRRPAGARGPWSPTASLPPSSPATSGPCSATRRRAAGANDRSPGTPPPRPRRTGEPPPDMTRLERNANLLGVLVPFAGLLVAIVTLWNHAVDGIDLAILAGMYLLTALGVTVGFHRLLTHRSFQTHKATEYVFAILGSLSLQGSVLDWVADHRKHHAHADSEGDPHSPHVGHGSGLAGLWHAHTGWLLENQGQADWRRYARELYEDPACGGSPGASPCWRSRRSWSPFALGGVLHGSWTGALRGLLWGGLVRIFFVHHITWSINSLCHYFGRRRFPVEDRSTNVFWLALPSLGEAWHHNHHAFPRSAAHGLRWWELDPSAAVIRTMERLGLAWNVVRISPERQREKALLSEPGTRSPASGPDHGGSPPAIA